jgi:hypothetical protein
MTTANAKERVHTFFVLKEPRRPDRVVIWDTQDISVGRSKENDIAVDHEELSRRHALFTREGGGYVVHNRSEANGTFVNGQRIESHPLRTKDTVRVAELQFIFYRVTRNPLTLGLKVDYASQLKSLGLPHAQAQNADSTMLGLVEPGTGDSGGERFEVRPAGDFEYDLHRLDTSPDRVGATRDLDLELEGLDDLELPGRPAGALSLRLEIEGLSEDLRRALDRLLGKVVELPPLRIRVKDGDLG